MLIPHGEVNQKIIKPEKIPFISYPYEWSFGQLKDAALLTLKIQKIAMRFGMSLKDATSFNVQFLNGKPIFIDTLSFEKYKEGASWIAYRQFCEQFLAPLALMTYRDARLSKLLIAGVGSIPLDLAAKLLPLRAKLKPSLFMHIFMQARAQIKPDKLSAKKGKTPIGLSKNAMLELIDNLENSVNGLTFNSDKTIWTSYYSKEEKINNYSNLALDSKKKIVKKYLREVNPKLVWDLGANDGTFSRIAARRGALVVSLDNDYSVVEKNYLLVKKNKEKNILPLWLDIVNPTPALGWVGKERDSFLNRPSPDIILALALIHHLAIANNIPISQIAEFFAKKCKWLIIEFIPKGDTQVGLLLANREDIFPYYDRENFEKEFGKFFSIKNQSKILDSKRIVYLMRSEKNN